MNKRPLRQLSTYLVISYLFSLLLTIFTLGITRETYSWIATIIVIVLVGFFTWGASRVYTKESRGWFRTLRIFFFIGVFFLLINDLGMLYGAVKDPMSVFNQIMIMFFPKGGVSITGTVTSEQALITWGVFTSLTVLPLIPLWFLFSNAGKYFKEKKG